MKPLTKSSFRHKVALAFLLASLPFLGARAALASTSASDVMTYISSNGGSYSAAGHNVWVGGSMRMFVPRKNIQLVSITPPTFSAGCSGISMTTGGFSFINGDQLQQFTKSVMQSAKGYAMDLAIRTLCPMCADILMTMRDLSNWASKLSMDSCAAAKTLVNTVATAMTINPENPGARLFTPPDPKNSRGDNWMDRCAQMATAIGLASSMDEAKNGRCATASASMNFVSESVDGVIAKLNSGKSFVDLNEKDRNGLDQSIAFVNKTWAGLTASGKVTGVDAQSILMSMMGTSYISRPSMNTVIYSGWGDTATQADYLLAILLYGNNPQAAKNALNAAVASTTDENGKKAHAGASERILNVLKSAETSNGYLNATYLHCSDADKSLLTETNATMLRWKTGKKYFECTSITEHKIRDVTPAMNSLIASEGLFTIVSRLLTSSVGKIASRKGLNEAELGLINIAPLPVYRMLKLAAVSPKAAGELVESYSSLIAVMLAEALLREWMTPDVSAPPPTAQFAELGDIVQSTLSLVSSQIKQSKSIIGADVTLSQSLWAQLRQIDQIIMERATRNGVDGNLMFARSISSTTASNR